MKILLVYFIFVGIEKKKQNKYFLKLTFEKNMNGIYNYTHCLYFGGGGVEYLGGGVERNRNESSQILEINS
jgi:hypothetical protein